MFYPLLPTAREGNIFRSVCQSFCPQGDGSALGGESLPGGESASGGGSAAGGLPRGEGSASRGVCIQGCLHLGGLHHPGGLNLERDGVCIQVWEGVCIQGGLPLGVYI